MKAQLGIAQYRFEFWLCNLQHCVGLQAYIPWTCVCICKMGTIVPQTNKVVVRVKCMPGKSSTTGDNFIFIIVITTIVPPPAQWLPKLFVHSHSPSASTGAGKGASGKAASEPRLPSGVRVQDCPVCSCWCSGSTSQKAQAGHRAGLWNQPHLTGQIPSLWRGLQSPGFHLFNFLL